SAPTPERESAVRRAGIWAGADGGDDFAALTAAALGQNPLRGECRCGDRLFPLVGCLLSRKPFIMTRPALLGGSPILPQGPPDWPPPDAGVLQALKAAYRDGSWGKYAGGRVERLERRLAREHGVEFALACGSGTFAVELALRALKIGPGHEVVLAAYDYPGNFLAAHAVGATPVLADVAPHNWNLAVDRLAAALTPATRAVVVSHLHGGLVPMRRVMEIARAAGVGVVEDAAQAVGAAVEGRSAGAWGDVGVLSFGGSKLLTAGRGGAILTPR